MKALILAAGYATRLYPLTKEYPKPLLEVGKRPIIGYIIDKLDKINSVDEIFVVTNSKFINKFRFWKKTVKSNKKITLVDDLTHNNQDRLGAIGDIDFVLQKRKVNDDLLVIGGDNLFSGNLVSFISFANKNKPNVSIGLFRLKNRKDAVRYGVAKINKNKRIIDFKEKPLNPESNLVAMCLYYIPQAQLRLVKDYISLSKKKVDATGKYIDWLKEKHKTFGFVFSGSWFDIGDRKYLNAAKANFRKKKEKIG